MRIALLTCLTLALTGMATAQDRGIDFQPIRGANLWSAESGRRPDQRIGRRPILLQADDTAKFNERATRINSAIAEDLAKLGADCLKWGLNVAGAELLNQALEINAQNVRARRALGHERKQAGGKTTWEPNPEKAPPAKDGEVQPEHRTEYARQRDKIFKDAAQELVGLGKYAASLELADHARVAYEAALRFDPDKEDALRATGWVREGARWTHPREITERELAAKALAEPPESTSLDKLPDWAAGLGNEARPMLGIKGAGVTVLGSGGLHREALRVAAAARKLAAWALGGEGDLRVFVSESQTQHDAYGAARHPGSPGLAKDPMIIGDGEIAVLRDENEKLTLERIVFATARAEVRRRCGDQSALWFEIGFATAATQRLRGGVSLAAVSGATGAPDAQRWKKALLALIEGGKQPALEKVLVTRDLDEPAAMYAHWFARFLVQTRGAALAPFCAAVKGGEPMEDALKSATLVEAARLEKDFLAWIKRQP